MSVNSMTNIAIARRPDFPPEAGPPGTQRDMVTAAGGTGTASPGTPVTDALGAIAAYIPTETLTFYVALLAAVAVGSKSGDTGGQWFTFWLFAVLTPVYVWLIFAIKLKSAKRALPLNPTTWPLWEMIAGLIAFVAWAFALPQTPFAQFSWYTSAIAGVVVLIVATLLGLLATLFGSSQLNIPQADKHQ